LGAYSVGVDLVRIFGGANPVAIVELGALKVAFATNFLRWCSTCSDHEGWLRAIPAVNMIISNALVAGHGGSVVVIIPPVVARVLSVVHAWGNSTLAIVGGSDPGVDGAEGSKKQ
jgi:hypothetical protein